MSIVNCGRFDEDYVEEIYVGHAAWPPFSKMIPFG